MKKLIYLFPILLSACGNNSGADKEIIAKGENKKEVKDSIISFDEQYKVFESLGYHFNEGVTKDSIYQEITDSDLTLKNPDSLFTSAPFSTLYYYLGWVSGVDYKYNTNQCIWMDLEFIDDIESYERYMERMGIITNGELVFTDISTFVGADQYEYIKFKVNGISKQWKLAKEDYISEDFLPNFSLLARELKTKGNYTIYDNGGQQFVLDYMTTEELSDFIAKTGLEADWLTDTDEAARRTKMADESIKN